MPHAPDLSGCALEGRYELHEVIGEGAFGRVYRGRDRRLERDVAIKLIKPWWAEDPEWAGSFEREAQLLARVADPGIVQIFDVGRAPEGLFYVSELVEGESLAARLSRGPVPPWEAAHLAEQLCRALARAHARGVVHRDVKPANIMLTREGRVKVGDFGVARLAEGSTDAGATVVGTPRYMSPEQARGKPTTPATDVYSAGVVLYEMIAGRPPFTERAAVELALRHLHDPPPALPSSTPAPIVEVVARALSKAPRRRYRDGAEMAAALAALPAPDGARSRAVRPVLPRARRERSRHPRRPARLVGRNGAGAPPRGPVPGRGRGSGRGAPPPDRRGPAEPVAATRWAPPRGPRRNLNPAARRRSIAALVAAFGLLGAMVIAAVLLTGASRVRVPSVQGQRQAAIVSRARALGLIPAFRHRYASAPVGTAIAQRPVSGGRVLQGTTLRVTLSSGPPPVKVPQLAGQTLAAAQTALGGQGLHAATSVIPAPGVPAGTITSQSPAPGVRVARGSRVALDVAETPRWQSVTASSGAGRAATLRFHIRGGHWRLVYTMAYQGTCALVIFCSGPNANVTGPGGASSSFDLSDGGRQTQGFSSGPGDYAVTIAPGSDSARWSVWVEDWY